MVTSGSEAVGSMELHGWQEARQFVLQVEWISKVVLEALVEP